MAGVSEPFRYGEFRGLWSARALSLLGDQLARVALSVLVYDRTRSAALTGLAYALTFLPYLAGPYFAGIGDRRPRRSILLALDGLRAVLVGVIAIPGAPLPLICALLVAVTAVTPIYDAARSALLPELVPAAVYPQALGVFTVTTEAAQVGGFAIGGVIVATTGTSLALLLDAATFGATFLILATTVRERPPAAVDVRESRGAALRAAAGLVRRSPWLRAMLVLAWLNALWVVPEGLAAPYAARLGHGAGAVGLLLAAIPAGAVIGAVLVARIDDQQRRVRLMAPLVLLASAPLIACAFNPGFAVVVALWMLCGVGTGYNVAANAGFVQALPNGRRSQAIALVTTGMVAGQGLAVLIGGLAASVASPAAVVACAGGCGAAAAITLLATTLRPRRLIDLADSSAPLAATRNAVATAR